VGNFGVLERCRGAQGVCRGGLNFTLSDI